MRARAIACENGGELWREMVFPNRTGGESEPESEIRGDGISAGPSHGEKGVIRIVGEVMR